MKAMRLSFLDGGVMWVNPAHLVTWYPATEDAAPRKSEILLAGERRTFFVLESADEIATLFAECMMATVVG